MKGYLHQPKEAKDGCSPVSSVPENDGNNWIAVIDNYLSCVDDMMHNIYEVAGYSLIIAYSPNNTNNSVTPKVRGYGVPIVIVTEEFGRYLVDNALSEFTDPQIEALVQTGRSGLVSISLIVLGSFLLTLCLICCCFCGIQYYIRCQRNRSDHQSLLQRRRNFDRLHSRDRIARQELIESILRQLQQLQIDVTAQMPLGAEQTRRLPTQRYSAISESQEVCAICVDEFSEGDEQRVLPCNHSFHLQCIDEWLINHSDLCPLCKMQVPKDTQGNQDQGGGGMSAARVSAARGLVPVTDDDSSLSSSGDLEVRLLPGSGAIGRYGSV